MKKTKLVVILAMAIMAILLLIAGTAMAEYITTPLQLGVATNTSFNGNWQRNVFSYQPTESGYYIFQDATEWDDPEKDRWMYVYIYDESMSSLNYYSETSSGFRYCVKLEEGKTYYFRAGFDYYSNGETGSNHQIKLSKCTDQIYSDSTEIYERYAYQTPASQTDLCPLVVQTGSQELQYQWYQIDQNNDGSELRTKLTGETDEILHIPYAPNVTRYLCVVTAGTETEEIYVNVAPDYYISAVAAGPQAIEVQPNDTDPITLSVAAEGRYCEPVYQWYAYNMNSGLEEPIAGATGASYTVPNGAPGYYYCAVRSDIDELYGEDVRFAIYVDNEFEVNVISPRTTYVDAGTKVELEVSAKCRDGSPNYQWYSGDYNSNVYEIITGETQPTLTIIANEDTDSYYCRISDQYGNNTSQYFQVYVNKTATFTVEATTPTSFSRSIDNLEPITMSVNVKKNTQEQQTFTYQWFADNFPIKNAIDSSLTITPTGMTRNYYCEVSNETESRGVDFSVDVYGGFSLSADGEREFSAEPGQSVTMKVTSNSTEELTYRWYRTNNNNYNELVQAGSQNTLTVTAGKKKENYTCTATDGKTQSNVYFTVNIDTQSTLTAAAAGETDLHLAAGVAAPILKVNTTGGTGTIRYHWYRTEFSGAWNQINTALDGNGDTITANKSGEYICLVQDKETSVAVTFNVLFESNLQASAIGETQRTVLPESEVELEVSATGSESISYQWYKNHWGTYVRIPGATSAQYKTAPITESGAYRCMVSDGISSQIVEFNITMDNEFTASAVGDTYVAADYGEEIELTVEASCRVGDVHYQWRERGNSPGAPSYNFTEKTGTLKLHPEGSETKWYECTVTDDYGGHEDFWFSVRVYVPITIDDENIVTDVKVEYGGEATLTMLASTEHGELTYRWYRNIYDENGVWITEELGSKSTCTISDIISNNTVWCQVSNGYSTDYGFYTVTVDAPITIDYESIEQDVTVEYGEEATLTMVASTEHGELTYRWYREIYDENGHWIRTEELGSKSTCKISNVTSRSDIYCWVSNGFDSESISYTVTADVPITFDEDVRTVLKAKYGDSVTLDTGARTEHGKLTYEWSSSELDIGSDTTGASLTIPAVTSDYDYVYVGCSISNGFENEYIDFQIYIDHDLQAEAKDGNHDYTLSTENPGCTLEVNASTRAPGGLDITWYRRAGNNEGGFSGNEEEINGETGKTLNVTQSGRYRCHVEDGFGSKDVLFTVFDGSWTECYAEAVTESYIYLYPDEPCTLSIAAYSPGGETVSCRWYYEEQLIEGETGTSLTVNEPKSGTYQCIIQIGENYVNEFYFYVTVRNQMRPGYEGSDFRILKAGEAEEIRYHVSAAYGNVRYQWYKNGAEMAGENEASLTVTDYNHIAEYTLRYEDDYGNTSTCSEIWCVPETLIQEMTTDTIRQATTPACFSFTATEGGTYTLAYTGQEDISISGRIQGSEYNYDWFNLTKEQPGKAIQIPKGEKRWILLTDSDLSVSLKISMTATEKNEYSFDMPVGERMKIPDSYGQASLSTCNSSAENVIGTSDDWVLTAVGTGTADVTYKYSNGRSVVCHITVVANTSKLTIPAGVTTIEADAFSGDSSVQVIALGDSVTTVESGAFADMGNVFVRIHGWSTTFQSDALKNTNAVFICYDGSNASNYALSHGIPVFWPAE